MKAIALLPSALLALLCSAPASALIDVYPKEIEVRDEAVQVTVSNQGDRPEYVSVSLSRLLNPGVPLRDEKLEPIGQTTAPTLYAAPFQMSLSPGQSKRIALKPLDGVKVEQVYRLVVKPEVGKMETGRQQMAGMVVVNIAYSALVRQVPEDRESAIQVECVAEGARITATGTVRHRIERAQVDGREIDAFNVPGTPRLLRGARVAVPGQPACGPADSCRRRRPRRQRPAASQPRIRHAGLAGRDATRQPASEGRHVRHGDLQVVPAFAAGVLELDRAAGLRAPPRASRRRCAIPLSWAGAPRHG